MENIVNAWKRNKQLKKKFPLEMNFCEDYLFFLNGLSVEKKKPNIKISKND